MNVYSENPHIKDFKTLKVWQKANALEQDISKIVENFPKYEQYRLIDQLVRAIRSISANIAEGNTQLFIKRELFHANAALGSAGESRSHLLTAYQNNYITEEQYDILDKNWLKSLKCYSDT